ncbi:unnamed protein product [Boreogadus saida]
MKAPRRNQIDTGPTSHQHLRTQCNLTTEEIMWGNLTALTVCLLGTVFICGVSSTTPVPQPTPPPGTEKPTTIVPTIITTPVNPATKTTAENPATKTTAENPATKPPTENPATNPTSANPTSENPTNPTNPTTSEGTQKPHTTDAGPEPEPEGLSDGAIAGIAVGSIAGAAALGGGIFGLLKYTGKI